MHKVQILSAVIKKSCVIFILICIFLPFVCATQTKVSNIQPIKKIYLKKESDKYYFCVDFENSVHFSPRIHTLPKGAKLILSFKEKVRAPKTPKIKNHKLINGYFFEQIGESSLLMILSLKERVNFVEKRYTNNSIRLGFKLQKKRNIVIDAGHGGKDPGTRCLSGDYEKNIALIAAIELRNKLTASGKYNVILTRDRDQFVPIEKRKELAANADLLISLHTDSNSDKKMRGMSVYTLPTLDFVKNESTIPQQESDEYYKNLARSRKFANTLVSYIPTSCKFKNHPRRDVELKILKLLYPAILIVLGCVSNKIDNQLLHSRAFREKTNRAILYALDKFFEKEE